MTDAAEAPAPLPPGADEAPTPPAASPTADEAPPAAEASAPTTGGAPPPPQEPAKVEAVSSESTSAARSDDGDEAPSTEPAHEDDEVITLDSGLVDVKLVEAPESASESAPAPEPPEKKKKKEKDTILTKVYKKWLHTCDPKVRKIREPYRCPTGFLVQAVFAGTLIYFAVTNFSTTYFANYLSADDSPAQGSSPAARECTQPFVYITDTYRLDTDGTWSSRYSFWAPNGLVEASFFRFNASVKPGLPASYDTFGADMVSGLVKINKEGGNQTLLEQLMTLTMKRFMVGGDQFSNTNSIAFTGDARTWLDRQEVFTDLFAWRVGTAEITDYCDVQMVSSVIDGYEPTLILPPATESARASLACDAPRDSPLARVRASSTAVTLDVPSRPNRKHARSQELPHNDVERPGRQNRFDPVLRRRSRCLVAVQGQQRFRIRRVRSVRNFLRASAGLRLDARAREGLPTQDRHANPGARHGRERWRHLARSGNRDPIHASAEQEVLLGPGP